MLLLLSRAVGNNYFDVFSFIFGHLSLTVPYIVFCHFLFSRPDVFIMFLATDAFLIVDFFFFNYTLKKLYSGETIVCFVCVFGIAASIFTY